MSCYVEQDQEEELRKAHKKQIEEMEEKMRRERDEKESQLKRALSDKDRELQAARQQLQGGSTDLELIKQQVVKGQSRDNVN